MTAILQVEHLQTHFILRDGIARAVDDVSFTVAAGQIMGLVGESGSGKSMIAYSIMGLVDAPGQIVGGRILFQGQDLLRLSAQQMRTIRGNRIAMVFQDPMMSLNPVLRIDTQMIEAVLAHQTVSRARALALAREALIRVGIAAPDERLQAYPHQFSGGMRQRVAIAIALLNRPDLIICDEATTALDATIQGQILAEMQQLCRTSGTALVWITHDLSIVAGLADHISVMYAGRIVENGSVTQILTQPCHPYTHGLIACTPSLQQRGRALRQIPGNMPTLLNLPSGCTFRDRCERATSQCTQIPAIRLVDGRRLRCFHPIMTAETSL